MRKAVGRLVVIGGAEDRSGECLLLREFVRLSGGAAARLVAITVASQDRAAGGRYSRTFRRLGARRVHVVDVLDRKGAQSRRAVSEVLRATGVFFTGGDQTTLTSLLGGTEMDAVLHRRHVGGMTLGGTSAGAAVMSSSMIVGGAPRVNPRRGGVGLSAGLEFMHGTIIDTHFSERGRHGRLLTAVAECPQDLGLGLDEDTGIVVEDGRFQVWGSGAVTVLDAGAATYSNLPELSRSGSVALFGVKLHILPAGRRFDVARRRPA